MPDHDWRPLYPFPSHRVTIGGHGYHFIDEGQGPVLLMVHGNPTWSFYWRNIVLGLRDRFRCIAVDHIGCGLSDKPGIAKYGYRLADRVSDLNRFIEALDLRDITLVAHDWGGGIGMGAAVAAPERFRRFLLMNTAAFRAPRCPWRIRACRIPGFGPLAVQGLNMFVRAALHSTVHKPERMTREVRSGFAAPYGSWRAREAVLRFVLDIPMRASHPSYQTLLDIEAGLAQFRQHPVCLIWGMHDWCFTPQFLDKFLEFLPQAEVHRLPEAAHYVVEDAHEEIVPLMVDFLARHPLEDGN